MVSNNFSEAADAITLDDIKRLRYSVRGACVDALVHDDPAYASGLFKAISVGGPLENPRLLKKSLVRGGLLALGYHGYVSNIYQMVWDMPDEERHAFLQNNWVKHCVKQTSDLNWQVLYDGREAAQNDPHRGRRPRNSYGKGDF